MRDGPFGEGMVQAWIETDPDVDVVELVTRGDDRLRSMCLFDALVNNADRKAGHLLPTSTGASWASTTASASRPIRSCARSCGDGAASRSPTMSWPFIRNVCASLDGQLGAALRELLTAREVRATQRRAEELLREGRFPQPDPFRPAIPWPPF